MIARSAFFFLLLIHLGSGSLWAQDFNRRALKLTDRAEEEIELRNFADAEKLLKEAIKVDPKYPTAYQRLGSLYTVYQRLDSATYYYNKMVASIDTSQISEQLWNRITRLNYQIGNYELAMQALLKLTLPDSFLLKSIHFSVESIKNAAPLNLVELPEQINSYQLQYFPALTVDEATIIFTKRDANDPSVDEDLVVSSKINGSWIPAQSISPKINSSFNEGACSISADGRTLIFTACEGRKSYGSCDLYVSQRQGIEWSEPINLGPQVNSKYWDSQPSLSADGRTLYFSSNRKGGQGKRDLWVTRLQKDDEWSLPINLGPSINTSQDETTPFIHVNGSALFFSSNGYPGLGGFDLFLTTNEAGEWKKPYNLGYPINTTHDELSLFVNARGTTGYFAVEKSSGLNAQSKLVQFPILFDSLLSKSSYVTGVIRDAVSHQMIRADLRMTNLMDTTDTYFAQSDAITGRYFLVLTEGKRYGVFVSKSGYLFEDLSFVPSQSSRLDPDTLDIFLHPIREGESLILENIFFEFDDDQLSPGSIVELNEVLGFMKDNPKVVILIEGHTDNVGDEDYNLGLSERRAKTVYRFLTDRKIQEARITYKGFGSTQPIATNSTEQGREINRRINFRIISTD